VDYVGQNTDGGLWLICNSSVLSMLMRNVVKPLHESIDHLVWEME